MFIHGEENQGQSLILKFCAENSARDVTDFKVYFSHFCDNGSAKFRETWCAKSVVPAEDNVLHFYRLGTSCDLVDALKMYDFMAFGAGISRCCRHPHFLFVRFLAQQASPCW
uniref:Uncharacterized protein n=1 Tax=Rhipicephalus zambeziensis TaxID=60191 RepID=A0A224YJC3_9ACAR